MLVIDFYPNSRSKGFDFSLWMSKEHRLACIKVQTRTRELIDNKCDYKAYHESGLRLHLFFLRRANQARTSIEWLLLAAFRQSHCPTNLTTTKMAEEKYLKQSSNLGNFDR